MTILIAILIVIAIVMFYVTWGREYLRPKFPGFFATIEPTERWLWNKSETILWSRFLILLGTIPFLLDQLQLLNIPALFAVIPEKYQNFLPLAFAVCGMVSEVLRRYTTKPLAIVELPDAVPLAVEKAVAVAEAAKVEAVAVVEADKSVKAAAAVPTPKGGD